MGENRLGERLAQAGMGPDEIVVRLEQSQLLTAAVFVLTRRGTAPSHRCHPLTQAQIVSRSTTAVLICQPQVAKTCSIARCVPNTTRCCTATRRRRRMVFTTCA